MKTETSIQMAIPLNVDVHCLDGRCGRSTHLVINPVSEKVTHLVVRESWPSRTSRLVPVGRIKVSTPDVIVLDCTRKLFGALDPFDQTEFVYTDVPHYASDPKMTALWPHVVPAKRMVGARYKHIPPGELAIHRGTNVNASDGRVGRVDEFLVNPESGQITHLVLRKGHLWGERVVTIPISQIDHIYEKTVYLKIDKAVVGQIPAIEVRRPWRKR